MQRFLFLTTCCFIFITSLTGPSSAQTSRNGAKIKTIIVDPGHGGTDQGAKGSYSTEAQLTLEMSLKLEKILIEELPDTRIIISRRTDVYHNVREKAEFANGNKGDLFVCVHVNAVPPIRHREFIRYKTVTYYTGKGKNRKKRTKREPVYRYWTTPNPKQGTSTYVFAADRGIAKADAASERFESEAEVLDVPDPESPEAMIKARLWSQKFFKNSVRLASMIESEFVKIGRKSDGVLQRNHKGIWVLQATAMPSVLVETGFITNKEEEDYLNSEKGQEEIVRAIANAVIAYKNQLEAPRSINNGDSSETQGGNKPNSKSKAPQKPLAVMPPSNKKK
ncbi:MAG: N-acetylmuramoyl-L-alanine amidase [Chitinophagaceae bacterium]|nr:N-acetylmuramoyl-L-alanine amidase [Chitinophagaceae bacterium]